MSRENHKIHISIHASAKEATINLRNLLSAIYISIHASAKEATEENDEIQTTKYISIHASAKEATLAGLLNKGVLSYFNPRLREGGDFVFFYWFCCFFRFQSTPPRRRRQTILHLPALLEYFNPRLREGGDLCMTHILLFRLISIHASAKEATNSGILSSSSILISIHASAKEATNFMFFYISQFKFQSTPPRRRRLGSTLWV